MPDCLDGAEHRPAGVHSVVNQQYRSAREAVGQNNSPALQIRLQRQAFPSCDAPDLGWRETHLSNQRLIQIHFALMSDITKDDLLCQGTCRLRIGTGSIVALRA